MNETRTLPLVYAAPTGPRMPKSGERPLHSWDRKTQGSLAVAVGDRFGDDADVGDAGDAELVDHGGKGAEGNGFVSAEEDSVAGALELLFDSTGQLVDVDRVVAEINTLIFVDSDDETLLGDFLDGVSFWDIDFDAGLKDGSGDHEDDEQDEDNIDEGDHVDVGESGLSGFA